MSQFISVALFTGSSVLGAVIVQGLRDIREEDYVYEPLSFASSTKVKSQ